MVNSDAQYTANVKDSHGSKRQNPTPGLSGNPIGGQPSSDAGSAVSQNDVIAYEIEKSIIDAKTDNVLAIVLVIIAVLLLVIGYKRQSNEI